MHNEPSLPSAAPRFVRVKKATLALARATLQLRELAVTRMQLREALGLQMDPTWQEAIREWNRSREAQCAYAQCGLPITEDAIATLLGCDRWPTEIWTTERHELPLRFQIDLYKQMVVRVDA